jgi:hypothetical protein
MMRWGIYDSEVLTDLSLHNKSVLRRKANRKYSDVVFGTSIPIPIDDKLSRVKLNYINTRLNIGLRYEDLPRFKIVLNLKELLRYNHVLSYTRSEKDIDLLDRCFVGFLSEDNGFVILRKVLSEVRMPESLNRRYVNYNIYGSYGNVNKRYTIPCRLNLLTPDPIRICVSEGPFDILSVFVNKMIHADDSVYSAAVGSDMTSTFVHAMSEYGIVNPELHAYMDNDAKEYHTELLKNNLKRYACPLYFHWNSFEGEKDFGVSNERIAEFEERIL